MGVVPKGLGFSLVELLISISLLGTLGIMAISEIAGPAAFFGSQIKVESLELRSKEVLARLEESIRYAQGFLPIARIATGLGSGDGLLAVDTLQGFPASGQLLIDRDGAAREVLGYGALDTAAIEFVGLTRGQECTDAQGHLAAARVLWADLAQPIQDQVAPAANLFDGSAEGRFAPIFFEGRGTGFVFRVPMDPAGGTDYIEDGAVRWGAVVNDLPSTEGWSCLRYMPVSTVSEAAQNQDLNADGDQLDVFDLGRIEMHSWVSNAPNAPSMVRRLTPGIILQEQCGAGSDLDGDGFGDPIFLWDELSGLLVIRLSIFSPQRGGQTPVRHLKTSIFLSNAQTP